MGIFNGFPPISDPSWVTKTRKLLEFLDSPRNWKQLGTWSRRGALLRQSLAWLENEKEAGTFVQKGVLYWVNAEYLERLKAAEPTDNGRCSILEDADT